MTAAVPKPPQSTTSALSLLQAARSFRDAAAGMLNAAGRLDYAHQMHAFYLLGGFGLEVAMKSHLRHLGLNDIPELRVLSHDLVAAANALADRIGEDRLPANLFSVVRKLGPPHQSLAMRYTPSDADLSLPHESLVIEVLTELVDDMRDQLFLATLD